MFRRLVIVSVLAAVAMPFTVVLADSTIPEFNPLCWKEKECLNVRAGLLGKKYEALTAEEKKQADEGFSKNEAPCIGGDPDPWGKCLPANVANTEIAFGGQRRFLHIGDFIQTNYRYALGIVGILAAVMIIVAGFQWVTSGGNSEAITSAKKRIGGAIVGLFIAYMSYFILTTINPATVNLRLPQVWLVRPQTIMPEFCSTLPDAIKNQANSFALAANSAPSEEQLRPITLPSQINFDLTFTPGAVSTFACGKRFFVRGSGATTCMADLCLAGESCSIDFDSDKNIYKCQPGKIFGTIVHNNPLRGSGFNLPSVLVKGWEDPAVEFVTLRYICSDNDSGILHLASPAPGTILGIDIVKDTDIFKNAPDIYRRRFILDYSNEDVDKPIVGCGELDDPKIKRKGFVFGFQMDRLNTPNSEYHYIGKGGIDLGDWEFFVNSGLLIPDAYYFNADELKKGFLLNIDAYSGIKPINGKDDRQSYYRQFGITPPP